MKIIVSLIVLTVLVSCGKTKVEHVEVPGPVVESESVEYVNVPGPEVEVPRLEFTDEELVEDIIAEKNEYRDALGQTPLTPGLTCTLHNASNADLDVSFGAVAYTYSMHTEFNQPSIAGNIATNILPAVLRDLYKSLNYSVRCQGQIVVLDSGRLEFTLDSDDGSRLYVNNSLIIDNEGNHAMLAKSGTIVLERGVYPFRLDYSQSGGGLQGLILTSDDEVLSSSLFYR